MAGTEQHNNTLPFGSEDFMSLGLGTIAKIHRWKQHKHDLSIAKFVKFYGATPETCSEVWKDLTSHPNAIVNVGSGGKPKHLLLALRFLWKYQEQSDIAQFFGQTEKTVAKWLRIYVAKLAILLQSKMLTISDVDIGVTFLYTVDGTHCPIWEPRPFSTIWSSHKLGGRAGVNYEIALCIYKPSLMWIHGPVPAGLKNDIAVYKEALQGHIRQYASSVGRSVKGIGDKGYRGVDEFISTRNPFDPKEIYEFKDRALARHETYNSRLKNWKVLTSPFRHDLDFHGECFRAINTILAYQLNNGSVTLFDPYP